LVNEITLALVRRVTLQAGKPSQYLTSDQVDPAFYHSWDGKMGFAFKLSKW